MTVAQTAIAQTARSASSPVEPRVSPDGEPVALTPAEKKRQRILEAAARSFAEVGFVKSTVEEIARSAGVSKGLVYVHFESKEALLEMVIEGTLKEWREATRLEVERGGQSVRERLATMHSASIAFALRHPLLHRILERDSQLVLALVEGPARRSTEEWGEQLTALIEEGIAAGELRSDLDARRAAMTVQLLHRSFVDRLFESRPWEVGANDSAAIPVHDPELIETSIELVLRGMERER